MLLEHAAHGFQIELRGEIEHRKIFIVERLGHPRLVVVALGKMIKKLTMSFQVAFDIHAHKRCELHETGIDPSECAAIAQRHRGDEVQLEPFD